MGANEHGSNLQDQKMMRKNWMNTLSRTFNNNVPSTNKESEAIAAPQLEFHRQFISVSIRLSFKLACQFQFVGSLTLPEAVVKSLVRQQTCMTQTAQHTHSYFLIAIILSGRNQKQRYYCSVHGHGLPPEHVARRSGQGGSLVWTCMSPLFVANFCFLEPLYQLR